jgi:hypothetical protein
LECVKLDYGLLVRSLLAAKYPNSAVGSSNEVTSQIENSRTLDINHSMPQPQPPQRTDSTWRTANILNEWSEKTKKKNQLKKVTWNKSLTHVKLISPRPNVGSKNKFNFPKKSNHEQQRKISTSTSDPIVQEIHEIIKKTKEHEISSKNFRKTPNQSMKTWSQLPSSYICQIYTCQHPYCKNAPAYPPSWVQALPPTSL